jgi:beta-lactamase regulating signal transducer with metallopeptidase domain
VRDFQSPRLLISAAVSSPALSGFLRPILLLPPEFPGELTSREARLVLVHELIHLRRWDLPLNWVFLPPSGDPLVQSASLVRL